MSPRALAFLSVSLCLCGTFLPARAEDPLDLFEKKIRPVLVAECYGCHSTESGKSKASLKLDTRESLLKGGESGKPTITSGDPEKSLLIEAIRQTNPDLTMPPKKQLPAAVVKDFETWVRLGAPDPRTSPSTPTAAKKDPKSHWAFQPVRDPALPSVTETTWIRTPIDRFILARLDVNHLKPSPPADKRTLIRRAYFDLWGLPPTYDEVQAFERDPSPDAFAKVVDRLLASPRYGERWARYWLDLARYADTKGYVYGDREESRFVHSHNYRDWVINAFNQDLPYDRFLKLQIAADQIVGQGGPAEGSGHKVPSAANTVAEVKAATESDPVPPSPTGAKGATSPTNRTPAEEGGGEGRATTGSPSTTSANGSPSSNPNPEPQTLTPHPDLAALGFLTVGRRFLGILPDIIDDRIDTLTRTTQGLSVGCARCHDHKFDPIPTKDYYSLYGVFDATTERIVPLQSEPKNKTPDYLAYEAELKKRTEKFETAFAQKKEEVADRARARTADYLLNVLDVEKIPDELFYAFRDGNDLYPVIVRQWQQYLFSQAKQLPRVWAPWHAFAQLPPATFSQQAPEIVRQLDVRANPHVTAALTAAPLTSMRDVATAYGKLLQDANRRWKEQLKSDGKSTSLPDADWEELRQILYTADAPVRVPKGSVNDIEFFFDEGTRVQLGKLQKEIDAWHIDAPGATPQAVILEDRPAPSNPRVFRRGNPATKGEEVPRQYLEIVSGPNRRPFQHGSGRLEMAEQIASPANPLTARVMVNRLWLWHFGQALVKTPSDFGLRCDPPTHPDLLDHLATQFVKSGWSIKAIHRSIMLSNAYQQSGAEPQGLVTSVTGSNAPQPDPDNTLLSHFPLHRLDFESLRDSLLLASGQLDLTPGGRPVDLAKTQRRTVYARVDRQFLPGVLRTFDFANPDLHTPQRPQTTVPQQALFMMNSPFVQDRARALAQRTFSRDPKGSAQTPSQRITTLYHLTLQRDPTPDELRTARAYLESAASDPMPQEPKLPSPLWQYGVGEYDPATARLKTFNPLPHFTGSAWQGGPTWPDAKLGWAQLTAEGGHAGNDPQHAVVRRWTSPVDGKISLTGTLAHTHPEGHGVVARILSSRSGELATWRLHNRKATTAINPVHVKKGDTIDFVVSINQSLNNNDFTWSPVIKLAGDKKTEWNAKKDFAGPTKPTAPPLTSWEKYAQILLMSDEFVFVD